jgi:hypothetical protein
MGYMIEISESKVEKMSEYVEDMLWAGGELMHCLEKMKGESGYGERGGMNYREHEEYGRYGKHSGGMNERYPYMGMRDDEDYEDEMNERRGGRRRRDSRGRYM